MSSHGKDAGHRFALITRATLGFALLGGFALAAGPSLPKVGTTKKAMVEGLGPWSAEPALTVGETLKHYLPPGTYDGLGAHRIDKHTIRVFANHEFGSGDGYAYTLANGLSLTGSRVSFFDLNHASRKVKDGGLAYDTVYDRQGAVVVTADQINETGNPTRGFSRFCSASLVEAGTYGFEDTIFFTNEESGDPGHPHGGSFWALDVENGELWGVPALGRGAWENSTPIDTGSPNHVGLVMGDDTPGAPLYLYIGQKNAGGGGFLDRNGLEIGQLFCWAADAGDLDPTTFNGLGSARTGHFLPVDARDVAMAGMPGYDAFGWKNGLTLKAEADGLGCFSFSRPEDLTTNPANGTQVAFNSTGRDSLFGGADSWGTIYRIELDLTSLAIPRGDLTIIHDADGMGVFADFGIRSPDNCVWAADGNVYVQEDRSIEPEFGATSGIEASIYALDPWSAAFTRIAVVDRSVVAPAGTTDPEPLDIGNWETSGIIDVTHLFKTKKGETLLLADVQAHSLQDGILASETLVQGGQLIFLSND